MLSAVDPFPGRSVGHSQVAHITLAKCCLDGPEQVNGKWTAFIQRFSNQGPLKAHFNITFTHSPPAVSTMQGDSPARQDHSGLSVLLGDTSKLRGGAGD